MSVIFKIWKLNSLGKNVSDMRLEEIIKKVMLARPEISREDFLKMIKQRKEELGSYFTDEAIARVLASELGVKIPREKQEKFELSIKNIIGDFAIHLVYCAKA